MNGKPEPLLHQEGRPTPVAVVLFGWLMGCLLLCLLFTGAVNYWLVNVVKVVQP